VSLERLCHTDTLRPHPGELSPLVVATKALGDEIHRRPGDDMFLASKAERSQWRGAGQPTFRQAARLFECDDLLTARRGGFFGARPGAAFAEVMRPA
jgi:hypothetical protein